MAEWCLMRRANKRDYNHREIVAGLLKAGFSVADTSRVGDGFPDVVIGAFGYTALVEIKPPITAKNTRRTAADKLGQAQRTFRDEWKGSPVIVACCVQDVLFNFRLLQKRRGFTV